jgi:DNA-binding response OmpR family regulator
LRPAKHILLIAPDNDATAILRYVLRNSSYSSITSCYQVITAQDAIDALGWLREQQFDLLIGVYPVALLELVMEKSREIDGKLKIVGITERASEVGTFLPDALLFKPTMAELLQKVKVLCRRKKGPLKGSPSAIRVGQAVRDRMLGKKLVNGMFVVMERKTA